MEPAKKNWQFWRGTGNARGMDPEILASWHRSQQANVPKDKPAPQKRQNPHIGKHRSRLLEISDAYLRHLRNLLKCKRYSVALTDEQGIVLRLYCDEKTNSNELFFEGADWREERIGTNGAGTALVSRRPVVIFGPQHYCSEFKDWTCIGTPIIASNEKVLGALNLSVPDAAAQPYMVGMVLNAANSIGVAYASASAASQLAATMAHETRNPLTVASGFVQLIALGDIPSKYKDYAQLALDNIDRANDILTNFTNLLKSRANLELEAIDIEQSIADVIQHLECLTANRSISIAVQVTNGPALVRADSRLLRCVWMNILKNAIEAMEAGTIQVAVAVKDKEAKVTVHDQGPGIPKEILAKLFQPFNTHKSSGTGLGLAICREILSAFQGRIKISCPPRGGTAVAVCLPVMKTGS